MVSTINAEMPRGDIKADKPKLLVYIDRNVEPTISLKRRGQKTFGKKHTEVVRFYQTQDGTEGTKENEPAIVINRQSINWSITRSGKTLETFSQWLETFEVNQNAKFDSQDPKEGTFGWKSDHLDSESKEQGSKEEDIEFPIEKTRAVHVESKQETFEVNQKAKSGSEDTVRADHEWKSDHLDSENKEQDSKEDLDYTQAVDVDSNQESHLPGSHFATDHQNVIRVSQGEWISYEMHQALIEVDKTTIGNGDQNRPFTSKPSWFGLARAGSRHEGAQDQSNAEVVLVEAERKTTKAADGHRLTSSEVSDRSFAPDESGSPIFTMEVLNATRSQIVVERKIVN